MEETYRVIEAAATMAAKLQAGIRERAVAHDPRPQSAPAHTQQQSGSQDAPGGRTNTPGGIA